jgi:hypothetical protein
MTKIEEIFSAKSVKREGIVRRNKFDIDKLIGKQTLLNYVRSKQFHLIETGDQYIVICNTGVMQIHC